MLYLCFSLGSDEYALPADRVVQVLPNVPAKSVRGAPPPIVGSISYRGQFLPIVDLSMLECGHPSIARIGTRLVVTDVRLAERQERIGLLLENATDTFRSEPVDFKPFAQGPRGLVQLFDIDSFLPATLFEGLGAEWARAV